MVLGLLIRLRVEPQLHVHPIFRTNVWMRRAERLLLIAPLSRHALKENIAVHQVRALRIYGRQLVRLPYHLLAVAPTRSSVGTELACH